VTDLTSVIEVVVAAIKGNLNDFVEMFDDDAPLSALLAMDFSDGLRRALAAGGVAGYRTFLRRWYTRFATISKHASLARAAARTFPSNFDSSYATISE